MSPRRPKTPWSDTAPNAPAAPHDHQTDHDQTCPTPGSDVCARCGGASVALPRLHPADLDELAGLVAERLAETLGGGSVALASSGELVDAAAVAERLGVTPAWVREHADELGVRRLGSGPRPRLRFDLDEAVKVFEARTACEGSRGPQTPESPSAERRPTPRRRGAVRSSAQRVVVPAWEE